MADREALGRRVREVWVEWAREQPDPKPSHLVGWDDLDEGNREVDMRIGEALAGNFSEAIIRADERESCAFRLRSVFPRNFMDRHGLRRSAGVAKVLAAAAAELEVVSVELVPVEESEDGA